MSRAWWVGLLCLLASAPAWAAGSWVATAPAVRVPLADRETASRPLVPPGGIRPGAIESLVWRFEASTDRPLRARLCHAGGCMPLTTSRGQSRALAGLPASGPLQFHFSLAPGAAGPVEVRGLQVIVNYREERPDGGRR